MFKYEYQGETGLKNIAKATGIPFGRLKSRIYVSGMTLDDAINAGNIAIPGGPAKYEYQGIKGLRNIAAHVGISESCIHYRVNGIGMSLEEAIKMGSNGSKPFKPLVRRVTEDHSAPRYPDLMDDRWKLALGIGAHHDA